VRVFQYSSRIDTLQKYDNLGGVINIKFNEMKYRTAGKNNVVRLGNIPDIFPLHIWHDFVLVTDDAIGLIPVLGTVVGPIMNIVRLLG